MGDLNTCLLKNDHRSRKLTSTIESYNLNILPLNATHHFPDSSPSLLDLIFVSNPILVHKHGQIPADAFSYHDLIFLSYKLRPPKVKPQILMLRRNFRGIDVESLSADAAELDWNSVYSERDIHRKVGLFNSLLTQLYDVHAPTRPVKVKHLPSPWLTDEIKLIIETKNRAKAKLRLCDSPLAREKYKKVRNRCNTLCRDAQRRHIHKSVEGGDPFKVWKFLKSLGIGKQQKQPLSADLNIDLLNQHFSCHPTFDQIDCGRRSREEHHVCLVQSHWL
ncbi:unnamed protein product [Pieris macdunnoughi]|uniref:Endonuclease/exonuclease/phosphatase domain-containing protein n=1 Tax=Pieris macdunnoughi TaxID=345717 RepID=A0A821W843_9NEOP|nr:unnamed protein product [Pieris macdunnoughi]